jgi:hypothetical protein
MNIKKTYPIRYHYRNQADSDKNFILQRMVFIPEHIKDRVSNEYERLFGSGSRDERKAANTYLNDEAKKFHNERSASSLDAHREKMESMTKSNQVIKVDSASIKPPVAGRKTIAGFIEGKY